MSAQFRVVGAKELRSALKKVDTDGAVLGLIKDAHRDAADVIVAKAKTLAPVKTGRLRDSIRPSVTARGAGVMVGKKTVPYAMPIHWGWPSRKIDGTPFLYDAVDAERARVEDLYLAGLREALKRIDLPTT